MGATLKSKAARRHLDRAGELLGVTGGPDDGLAVCVAEMPTAGTISDGSVNRNWTGPGELGQPGIRVLPEGKPV